MIAAIYARKSTDDSDRHAEARSTRRQVESATRYAELRGWTVDPRYIFVDENMSGAEWKHRPGFNALLAALEPRPPFDVVIVSELSRIGRASARTLYAITQIEEAGVEIHGYLKGRPVTLEDEAGEVETTVDTLVSSLERRRARQRTSDALRRRAEAGAVTGGRVFGYRNERNGTGYVHRVIDEAEATTVRRIFTLYAEGDGLTRIAKRLNADAVPAPPGRHRLLGADRRTRDPPPRPVCRRRDLESLAEDHPARHKGATPAPGGRVAPPRGARAAHRRRGAVAGRRAATGARGDARARARARRPAPGRATPRRGSGDAVPAQRTDHVRRVRRVADLTQPPARHRRRPAARRDVRLQLSREARAHGL
jgi:DNA invertase Pin-like site-specific DNA recombinase